MPTCDPQLIEAALTRQNSDGSIMAEHVEDDINTVAICAQLGTLIKECIERTRVEASLPIDANLSIFLVGVSSFRSWERGMEVTAGAAPLLLLDSLAQWATLWFEQDVTVNVDRVHFEVISTSDETAGLREAFRYGLEYMERPDGWAEIYEELRGGSDMPFSKMGNLSWGRSFGQPLNMFVANQMYTIRVRLLPRHTLHWLSLLLPGLRLALPRSCAALAAPVSQFHRRPLLVRRILRLQMSTKS